MLNPGQNVTGACAGKSGEVIGVRDYGRRGHDYSIAIRAEQPEGRQPSQGSVLYAFGLYSDNPGPDNFCVAERLGPAFARYSEEIVDGGILPEIEWRYEWRNVRFLVTPLFPGTQMISDLTYSERGCAADYTVTALWPAVRCDVLDGGMTFPDQNKCTSRYDPVAGITLGCAGGPGSPCLSPYIRAICDPKSYLCVLDGTPPVQQ
jgi:hypothetical protein